MARKFQCLHKLKTLHMSNDTTILDGYSNLEKGAYLGAIASIATADRNASPEELEYIQALIDAAGITADQSELIMHAAKSDVADADLQKFLQVLKSSELRFSLVSDVIAFAQADNDYSEAEQQKVKQIASYLDVDDNQLHVLNDFTSKAVQEGEQFAKVEGEGKADTASFFGGLGFGDKLKNAGINTNSLFRGALGIIGPMLLARLIGGKKRGSAGSGMLGGLLGGMLGGGKGGLLGGLLGGGRGFGNAAGMLGRLFKK
ncbi:MAG: TerB family tellurite resistance protein [Chitinophagaceae bacterium]|nr:MAG: TerB family tellurite resistance protein [Chitinophagaceae bacterium]